VIITTYNRPDALQAALHALSRQSVLPNAVIIADDGSTQETADLIAAMMPQFPVPMRHCWQPDMGFRPAAARNKAIAMSHADYIIIIDGDIICHRHFVRDHLHAARRGHFVHGSRVLIGEKLSHEILLAAKIPCIRIWTHGIKKRIHAMRCKWLQPLLAALLSRQKYMAPLGCNMAFWRSDAIAVNGFNEDFTGWGREDNEFAARMLNSGVRLRCLRMGGVQYHLWHAGNSNGKFAANDHLLRQCVEHGIKRCERGIDQY
jgi:glycosyltransferase involved in cell wall biosynthesis